MERICVVLALVAGCGVPDDWATEPRPEQGRGRGSAAETVAAAIPARPPDRETPEPAVTVQWTFPGLVRTAMGSTFPTYLAHLFGKHPDHPLDLRTACVTVTNTGTAVRARLRVDLPVYAQPATQDLALPPGSTTACLDPIFDLGRLYALRDTTPARLEASLADSTSGTELGATMQALALVAHDEIAWNAAGAAPADLRDLAAVFVTPKDPEVDRLQRRALEHSAWTSFGGGDPYQRPALTARDSIGPGEYLFETLWLEEGERIGWELLSATAAADLYLFTPAEYEAWRTGKASAATMVWTGQSAGARGAIAVAPGGYLLVLINTSSATEASAVAYRRDPTREDVARDVLGAVYQALQALGTRYSNIPATYFDGWQHVRRPREVLRALSANCIDGSFLFASVLELLALEPVLILTSGHAYVGIRSGPGSPLIWPVETTLLESADFPQAYQAGIRQLADDRKRDPQFRVLDLKALRARGILPLPQ